MIEEFSRPPGLPYNDPNVGNSELEEMNNFHLHMPGGLYRLDSDHPDSVITAPLRQSYQQYGELLDKPEETWPEGKAKVLKALKVKRAIVLEVDEFLKQNPEIYRKWEAIREASGKMTDEDEAQVLRPVYRALRQKGFTQAELIS